MLTPKTQSHTWLKTPVSLITIYKLCGAALGAEQHPLNDVVGPPLHESMLTTGLGISYWVLSTELSMLLEGRASNVLGKRVFLLFVLR